MRTCAEQFEKVCPWYLSHGMSLEEFWDGPAESAKYYREKAEYDQREMSLRAWLNGAYVYEALLCASAAFRFGGGKIREYPSEPHPMTAKEKKEAEKRSMESRRDAFRAMAEQFNRNFKK